MFIFAQVLIFNRFMQDFPRPQVHELKITLIIKDNPPSEIQHSDIEDSYTQLLDFISAMNKARGV